MSLILNHGVDEAVYLAHIPRQPVLRPLTPWETLLVGQKVNSTQQHALLEPFLVNSDRFGPITVPATSFPLSTASFVIDLASIPALLQGALQNNSPQILCGSLPHDFAFWMAGEIRPGFAITFAQSVDLLAEVMWYCNATDAQIDAVAFAVNSCFARQMWNANCDRLGHPERKVALV